MTETSARFLTLEKRTPSPKTPRRYATRGRGIEELSKCVDLGTISTLANEASIWKNRAKLECFLNFNTLNHFTWSTIHFNPETASNCGARRDDSTLACGL